MKKAVIILSGGVDSTTLLHELLKMGYSLNAISFNYGQKQVKEAGKAHQTCLKFGIPHTLIDMRFFKSIAPCALTSSDIEIPPGLTTDESMKSTVVPSRNLVMLSIAISFAQAREIPEVYFGAQKGDYTIYPDCRPEFVKKLSEVSKVSDHFPVKVFAPYTSLSKKEVIGRGLKMKVDYSLTWSCYTGNEKPCGLCGACTERLDAFKFHGEEDPLSYDKHPEIEGE